MTNPQSHSIRLILKVPLMILLLITMGNLIMLLLLRNEIYTWKMFTFASVNSVLIGGAFMIGLSVMVNILDRKIPWLHFPLKRLIVQFLVTIVFSLIIIVSAILFNGFFTNQKITSAYFLESGLFMVKIAFTFIFVSSLVSNAVLFFRNWKEAAVQQEKLKREQLALQYETLKSQVNPHFLFNNLNSLTSLINANPEKAIDFVKQLSEVYRYVLDQKDQELVELETEMNFLKSYIFLQKIRFGENLRIQIESLPQNVQVIPLSVQLLVENAIKFTPNGGKVEVLVRTDLDRKTVRILVKDTGPGIPTENLPHIFERFYRAEPTQPRSAMAKGSGLGLAIAKSIVENHGGKIGVNSQQGEGTTMWAELPADG